jgi:hypothetical protein
VGSLLQGPGGRRLIEKDMARFVLLVAAVPAVLAGSVEFSSTDLVGKKPSLDNVKASWGTKFSVAGMDLKIDTQYDQKAKPDFLKEATLSGTVAPVSYSVTQNFVSGASKLALSTKQAGATFKAVLSGKLDVGGAWLESGKLDSVAITKAEKFQGIDITLEPSYTPAKQLGELKAQVKKALGSGLSVTGEAVATTGGAVSVKKVELALAKELDGRPVKAVVSPLSKVLEVQITDKDWGVATATYALGTNLPKVNVKRSFSF